MPQKFDAAIVGGGIAGLANAWMAARTGRSVILFERNPQANGASVRNFGMIWVIGQPLGEPYELACRSRELWLEFAKASGAWMNPCGSLHLAHQDDEWAVLNEFSRPGLNVELLTPEETLERSPAANPEGLQGSLWSETEMAVNPREAITDLTAWLRREHGLTARMGTTVSAIDGHRITLADGSTCEAERIVVCSGSDIRTLYPEVFSKPELQLCKLQMMRTIAQPKEWQVGPLLAGGLTLHRYEAFADCPSRARLNARISDEFPEVDRFGIHTMAAQLSDGSVVLGDSHEYGPPSPSDNPEIDSLILREQKRMIRLPSWEIEDRWHGVYLKHTKAPYLIDAPSEHVRVMSGLGGAGMTLSFGLAEKLWHDWDQRQRRGGDF